MQRAAPGEVTACAKKCTASNRSRDRYMAGRTSLSKSAGRAARSQPMLPIVADSLSSASRTASSLASA